MLPDVWVILSQLPVSPNGKVNRKALPEPAGESVTNSEYQPPMSTLEKSVATIWENVLERRVGIDDHFFEIGGHSLKAVQIISRIRHELGIDASLPQLFTFPTVRTLAHDLSNSSRRKAASIPTLPAQSWYAVSHAQKRIWLACRKVEASVAYNMAGAFRLEGELSLTALSDALMALVARHESLRTVLALVNGELKQKIQSVEQSGFEVARMDVPFSVDELIERESERPFDLAVGPLFRAAVVRLADSDHILLITMHHIISDAWSVRILMKELRALYDAFNSGEPSPLEPLTIQNRDYAAWHNRLLESVEMNAHREYWKRRLQPDMPRLELPVDHPRTAAGGLTGGRAVSIIDQETTRGLTRLAQRCGTSLFGAVLASICVLLYRYTGQQEIIAGFQSTGREHHQLEDQIGAYLNTVVLRAMLEPARSIAEIVSSIGETLLEALDHSAYPFDLLLEELRPRTPVNRSPIFDVQLDYIPGLDSVNADGMNKGLAITDLSQETARTKYDLSILILESSKGLEVITVYNANLFRRETIETTHRRLAIIQKAFLEDDATRISDIELFGEGTRAAGKRVRVGLRLGGVGQEVAAGDSIG